MLVLASVALFIIANFSAPLYASNILNERLAAPDLNAALTLNPVEDTFADSSNPNVSHGGNNQLKTDSKPTINAYLRFDVSGVTSPVTQATLRLYANTNGANGFKVVAVNDNSWTEKTLNYSNAPSLGNQIGASGAVNAGAWTDVDVTGYVTGNGSYSFGLKNSATGALKFDSREAGNRPQLVIKTASIAPIPGSQPTATKTPVGPTATRTPTKVALPTATRAPTQIPPPTLPSPGGNVQVLCDGKTYDGFGSRLFQLDSGTAADASIQKVIRNCVFRNSSQVPIVIKNAKNVLIEGSTFENIRTHIAGDGVHGINITGPDAGGIIDGVIIRNNTFRSIGADGIQIGQNTRNIRNVYIQNNEFVGGADVGENGVDVKGADGPIVITGNRVHGFRPCESPKTNPPGTQDCSGSNGPGITIHDGGIAKTPAYNVTLENNDLYDNTIGLVVATGAKNIVVRGNRINNNLKQGIEMHDVYSVSVTGNTLSSNPTHISVSNSPQAGGSCVISNNMYVGGGTPIQGGCK